MKEIVRLLRDSWIPKWKLEHDEKHSRNIDWIDQGFAELYFPFGPQISMLLGVVCFQVCPNILK